MPTFNKKKKEAQLLQGTLTLSVMFKVFEG